MMEFRTNGAKGAILDEYERAIKDLQQVIMHLSNAELARTIDPNTKDPDCHSIQNVLTHVVRSGYGYANAIRKHQGEAVDKVLSDSKQSAAEYISALDDMFAYNVQLFNDYPNLQLEELDNSRKMLTSWGQLFDPEQLLEHAIVHILRHRRQIERFAQKT